MKKRLRKKKYNFKVGDFVWFNDFIYSICFIEIRNKIKFYRLVTFNHELETANINKLKLIKTKQKKFKISDELFYYDQYTDTVKYGKILKFEKFYANFTNGDKTFIDYLDINNKRMRKYLINEIVKFNEQSFKIIDWFRDAEGFFYVLENGEIISENELSK
jgi:hypothetical protein